MKTNNNSTKYWVFLGLIIVLMAGCKKDSEKQAEADDKVILDYLADNDLSATKHESGMYYIINAEGNGYSPSSNSVVEVKYKGYLTNGTVFDETEGNSSATMNLSGLITGWRIGLPMLKKGGKGTFFIPSALGYGSNATGNIPENSVLIFEIELIDFI
ncbi:MAG: peptidylprolyl isomerase [Chlorobi bacterium]|nr:peptidylprolyl isomerase [Chlorobiota bacterium]